MNETTPPSSSTDRGGVRAIMLPSAVPAFLAASTDVPSSRKALGASVLAAPAYSAKVARQIIDLEVTVQPIQIGGAWGLDLSSHSCEICGGTFPTRGDASMFLTRYGDPAFVHLGCEKQVEDWA